MKSEIPHLAIGALLGIIGAAALSIGVDYAFDIEEETLGLIAFFLGAILPIVGAVSVLLWGYNAHQRAVLRIVELQKQQWKKRREANISATPCQNCGPTRWINLAGCPRCKKCGLNMALNKVKAV